MSEYNPAELAQTLFAVASDALFLFDPNTERLVDANPTAERLTGLSRQDLHQATVPSLFRSETPDGLDRLRQACRTGHPFRAEEGFLLRRREGSPVHVALSLSRLPAASRPLGLLTAHDLSERRQAQTQLEQHEVELHDLLASVSDYIWSAIIDSSGRFTYRYYSPVVEQITGRPPAFYLEAPERWVETVHPEDRPRLEKAYVRAHTGQSAREEEEYRVVRPDGSVRWVRDSVMIRRGDEGRTLHLHGVVADITTHKQAGVAQRESEARYRTLAEASSVGIWHITVTGHTVYVNPAMCALLELEDPEELVGQTYHAFFTPESLATIAAEQAKRPQATTSSYEAELVGKLGRHHYVVISGAPLLGALGNVQGYLGTFTDISERTQAEEALRRSEERYRDLFENANDIIYTHDLLGNFTSINRAAERITGYSRAEALQMQIQQVLVPSSFETAQRMTQRKLTGESTPAYDVDIFTRDGRRQTLEVNSRLMFWKGKPIGVEGIARDVTERKHMEAALRTSEAKYRSLVEHLEQSIFLKDSQFRFIAANQPFCRDLGRPEAEVLGKSDYDFYPKHLADKYRSDDLLVLREGKHLEIEEQNLADGKPRTVRVVKTPVRDDQGRAVGVLGIFWDVTHARALEAQLRQAQKMEAAGQLAGGIAHDFNNLLTAVLGNLTLVLAGLPGHDPHRELLAAADKAAVRAAELTRQLLSFSRQTLLRPQTLCLNGCTEEAVRLLRRTVDPRVSVQVRSAADLWAVQADPSQMIQVLMNLCLNARDAMPQGGLLSLETANVLLDEAFVRLHPQARPGAFVRLRVSDTGHGIPPEVKPRIFEPFFTTKGPSKGTGLGLAVVFGIVQQHQGWIDCYSEVDQGTRFDIYLPRVEEPAAVPSAAPHDMVRGGGETILLADDEPLLRDLGQTILQRYGYRVLVAEDGEDAVNVFRQEQGRIALVILDLTMPRLSGRDALHQLRQVDPQVRVLFASGYSAQFVPQADGERVLGFVGKPYRPEELARQVRDALDALPGTRNGHT